MLEEIKEFVTSNTDSESEFNSEETLELGFSLADEKEEK